MNLQQLEYIVAVDTWHNFSVAAEKCHITQPTLSMMIQKLELELGIQLFDRSKQPVVTTDVGKEIILQARRILDEVARIHEITHNYKGEVKGELRLGIIPTLSPYLLPLFLNNFLKKYPQVKVKILELTTQQIVERLTSQLLDVGILATPLHLKTIAEDPLFYEEFVVYTSAQESGMKKKYVIAEDIDVDRLWLLEEGHCLRSQVINLCELKKRETESHNLEYEVGSIETLKKIVDMSKGITILPELAMMELSDTQLSQIHYFKPPAPVREISLVTYHHFIKTRLVEALKEEILAHIPEKMKHVKKRVISEVEL